MNFYRHTIIITPNIYIPMIFVYDFLHHKDTIYKCLLTSIEKQQRPIKYFIVLSMNTSRQ